MCVEMGRTIDAFDPQEGAGGAALEGKANRWLGFVQGVLWSTGRRTVTQMKDDNRTPGA